MKRIVPSDLKSTLQFATPNVVVYTKAEMKAFNLNEMMQTDGTPGGKNVTGKRTIQTMLRMGPTRLSSEVKLSPNIFPPQLNPLNTLIPQLITLNRKITSHLALERDTMGRQPERDRGIIREGKISQWLMKQSFYHQKQLGRCLQPAWIKELGSQRRQIHRILKAVEHNQLDPEGQPA